MFNKKLKESIELLKVDNREQHEFNSRQMCINEQQLKIVSELNKKVQDLTARVEILEKKTDDIKFTKTAVFDLFDRVWALEKKLEENSDDGLITFDKPLKIDCYHCGRFVEVEKTVYMHNHHFCPECAEEIKKTQDENEEVDRMVIYGPN